MNRLPLLVSLFVAAALALVHAASPEQEEGVTREFRYLMGTSVEVRTFGGDVEARSAATEEAFAAVAEVDRVMSNWRGDSEVTRANREAGESPVRLSDPLFAVIRAGQLVADRSGGAFDLTVGPLMTLWGFRPHDPHLPTAGQLAAARAAVNYHNILLDEANHTMRFLRPGVEVDLGGIAKGFAVELAAGVLRRHRLSGFIDAGGNQYMLGLPPGRPAWTVGVRDPNRAGHLLGVLDLPEGSVSTSAQYANFMTVNGRSYGHILDPRTMAPSEASLSVTLYSPDGTLADAVSKAAFVLGPERGLSVINSFPGMLGVMAFRQPDGSVGLAMTDRARAVFHPVPPK